MDDAEAKRVLCNLGSTAMFTSVMFISSSVFPASLKMTGNLSGLWLLVALDAPLYVRYAAVWVRFGGSARGFKRQPFLTTV